MLNGNRKITLEEKSVVDGVEIAVLRAVVTKDDISFLHHQSDKEACKVNRGELRRDQAEFEDWAYEMQEVIFTENESEDKES